MLDFDVFSTIPDRNQNTYINSLADKSKFRKFTKR